MAVQREHDDLWCIHAAAAETVQNVGVVMPLSETGGGAPTLRDGIIPIERTVQVVDLLQGFSADAMFSMCWC
jgi:hypothetical protein